MALYRDLAVSLRGDAADGIGVAIIIATIIEEARP